MIKPYRFDNDQRKDEPFWCEHFAMSRWLSGPGPVAELCVGAAQPVAPDEVNLAAVKDEVTFLRHTQHLQFRLFHPRNPIKSLRRH